MIMNVSVPVMVPAAAIVWTAAQWSAGRCDDCAGGAANDGADRSADQSAANRPRSRACCLLRRRTRAQSERCEQDGCDLLDIHSVNPCWRTAGNAHK